MMACCGSVGIVMSCVCAMVTVAWSQPTLSGRVTDQQGSPLENAVVDLKAAGLRVITNEHGEFDFGGSSSTGNTPRRRSPQPAVVFKHNCIVVPIRGNRRGPLRVDLFSLSGRKRTTLYGEMTRDGFTSIAVPDDLASGIWNVRISRAHKVFTVSFVKTSNGTFFSTGTVLGSHVLSNRTNSLAKAGAASDTLTAFKYGYFSATQHVSDLDAKGLEIQLTAMAADSIVPPGMKRIPGGTFTMGTENGTPDEMPLHEVTVSSFFMDSTEVTQMDFASLRLCTSNPGSIMKASIPEGLVLIAPRGISRGTMECCTATNAASGMDWIPCTHIRQSAVSLETGVLQVVSRSTIRRTDIVCRPRRNGSMRPGREPLQSTTGAPKQIWQLWEITPGTIGILSV